MDWVHPSNQVCYFLTWFNTLIKRLNSSESNSTSDAWLRRRKKQAKGCAG